MRKVSCLRRTADDHESTLLMKLMVAIFVCRTLTYNSFKKACISGQVSFCIANVILCAVAYARQCATEASEEDNSTE